MRRATTLRAAAFAVGIALIGTGQANISPSADPVAIAQACAGAGLTEAPVDIQVSTTPSISG